MSDDQRLHPPAPVVTKRKPVQMRVESLPGDVPAVHSILTNQRRALVRVNQSESSIYLLLTVNGVVGHGGVNPDNDGAHSLPVLVEQELTNQRLVLI